MIARAPDTYCNPTLFFCLLFVMSAKIWCFTLNNYSEKDCADLLLLQYEDDITDIVVGKEFAPDTDTPHLQGVIRYREKHRFGRIRRDLPAGCHVEQAKGTLPQNIRYCSKDGEVLVNKTS